MQTPSITVALVGNPNTGKSTLFNALSGLHQRVGNYPGVTVELKKGSFSSPTGIRVELIDLPGTYSLAPRSPDEMVAVDLLLGRRPEEKRPDVVISVVDASNLARHLYLTTQLLELGVPVVLAVNMIDTAENQGIRIDCARLSQELGIPVVPIRANKGIGLDSLVRVIVESASISETPHRPSFPIEFEKEVVNLQNLIGSEIPGFLTRRLLLDVGGYTEQWLVARQGAELNSHLASARANLTNAGCGIPGVEARTRYGWIRPIVAATVSAPKIRAITWTDKLDKILTHRLWGTLIFLLLMFAVFQSIFIGAKPLMDLIDQVRQWAGKGVEELLPQGPLRALLADGVVKGVGSVLVFLPQILILFAIISILEDCGYMARAAYLMDRLMSRCGLSGKSFIPLLSSVACAVPGIMATRVIENRRDRLATILVAPLMSCSARLPVYILVIAAFLPVATAEHPEGFPWWTPGLTLFLLYMIGFTIAPIVALILKRSILRGSTPLFVMELPAYKWPVIRGVLMRVSDAGKAFIVRAGTIILFSMILVWALLYFPNTDAAGTPYEERIATATEAADQARDQVSQLREENREIPEELQAIQSEPERLNGEWKRRSILGQVGVACEPIFAPLGWDWRIGMAAIASFPAREVIVGTLGLIYDVGEVDSKAVGDDSDEKALGLRDVVRREWASQRDRSGIAVAFSVMVFMALCMQCTSTLVVIYRETRSWKWPVFAFVYMTLLAYLGAMATFQIGRLLT